MKIELLTIFILGLAVLWISVEHLKNKLVRCFMRGSLTIVTILILNIIAPMGRVIVNGITIIVGAILGIPGIMYMYVLRMLYP